MASTAAAAAAEGTPSRPGSASGEQPLALSSGPAAAEAPASGEAAAAPPHQGPRAALNSRIQELKRQQQEQKAERKRLARDLRNEERKKKRLREKAKQLTDDDLLTVLRLRQDARVAAGLPALENAEHTEASGSASAEPSAPSAPSGSLRDEVRD